jgi:trehalose 6-phosphate synthase/phosphatase
MLDGMLAETELRAYRGNKIVEVKPMSANKGEFANTLLQQFQDADFVLAAGDDRTDEDMFARMPTSAWTIRVGRDDTKASYWLNDVDAVRDVLSRMAGMS